MDEICCIFDFQGFVINGKFMVREFGWVNMHSDDGGIIKFDLRPHMKGISQKDQNVIRYNENNIHGLSFLPTTGEDVLDLNLLQSEIDKVYNKCKRGDKNIVLYKGIEKKDILGKLPSKNLYKLGCPKYSELKKYHNDGSACGSHKNGLPCCLQLANTYKLWVKENMEGMEIYPSESDEDEETDESE